ncbi:hypothetical protein GS937_01340, partial [Rhodococcus hoagii]|nr:hypothetical protein [Prescottella equi]
MDRQWAELTAALSRRGFLGAIALGATAFTVGCGTSSGSDTASAATRAVTTPLGTYDIPVAPQRVVVIDSRLDLEPALALELPVIATSYDTPAPWLPPVDARVLTAPVDLEEVLGLAPDLIVCVNLDSEMCLAQAARHRARDHHRVHGSVEGEPDRLRLAWTHRDLRPRSGRVRRGGVSVPRPAP